MSKAPESVALPRPSKRQKGVTLLEYAIIAALIAAVTIAIISAIGGKVNNTFATINNQLK